jgi:hypothetical protein
MRSSWIPLLSALALGGCPSPAPPVFPESYASTYTEVRDCRRSPEHELSYIRVWASPEAAPIYTSRTGDFPEGAVIVKEEFANAACTDLLGWTAMRREGGDWRWQDVALDRTTIEDGDIARCTTCHDACATPPAGYMGTCAVP